MDFKTCSRSNSINMGRISTDGQRGVALRQAWPSFVTFSSPISSLLSAGPSVQWPLHLAFPSPVHPGSPCFSLQGVIQWKVLIFSAAPPSTQRCPLHPSPPLPAVPLVHGHPASMLGDFSSHWTTCPTPWALAFLTSLFSRVSSPVPPQPPSPIS